MKKPSYDDAMECIALRCKSRRGEPLTKAERKFSQEMYEKYPEWYGAIEPMIFNMTVPFGSDVRKKEDPEAMDY